MEVAEFKLEYPEFSEIDDSIIDRHLQKAQSMLDEDLWRTTYQLAIGLLAAHEIELKRERFLEEQQIAAGIQTGTQAKRAQSNKLKYYEQTIYGEQYRILKARLGLSGFA